MPKPVLLGLDNPRSSDPRYALYPWPPGCTGWRIKQWSGLTTSQYTEGFDRRNLVDGNLDFEQGTTVVALGRAVWRRLDLPPHPFFDQLTRGGVTYYAAPHPSGRSRLFNSPENRERLGDLIRRLYFGRHDEAHQ